MSKAATAFAFIAFILGAGGIGLGAYAIYTINQLPLEPQEPIGARVYLNKSYTVPDLSTRIVDFDNETYDPFDDFNLTSNNYTAPENGPYLITGSICLRMIDTAVLRVSIYVNNSMKAESLSHASTNDYISASVTDIILLSAGDKVTLRTFFDKGGSGDYRAGQEYTFLTIHKIAE